MKIESVRKHLLHRAVGCVIIPPFLANQVFAMKNLIQESFTPAYMKANLSRAVDA